MARQRLEIDNPVRDLFVEFRWGYVLALFVLGWVHGRGWRMAVSRGGAWVPVYALMVSLSVYLVMQTLEAMAFRFLLTAVPTVVLWKIAHRPRLPASTRPVRPRPG